MNAPADSTSPFPRISSVDVPYITADQMRDVDRAMVEKYGISLVQMMENAGRNLAHLARVRFLNGDARGRRVVVLAGTGGNGGGGLVCARRLHGWGASVEIVTTAPASSYEGVPASQLDILQQISIPITHTLEGNNLPETDLIVDAIIGYSLRGAPTGGAAALIRQANSRGAPVLALDVPSGIDVTTGQVHEPAIRGTATLTLALPKTGLKASTALGYIGELYLADIGVPPELYVNLAINHTVASVFARQDIVRLT